MTIPTRFPVTQVTAQFMQASGKPLEYARDAVFGLVGHPAAGISLEDAQDALTIAKFGLSDALSLGEQSEIPLAWEMLADAGNLVAALEALASKEAAGIKPGAQEVFGRSNGPLLEAQALQIRFSPSELATAWAQRTGKSIDRGHQLVADMMKDMKIDATQGVTAGEAMRYLVTLGTTMMLTAPSCPPAERPAALEFLRDHENLVAVVTELAQQAAR